MMRRHAQVGTVSVILLALIGCSELSLQRFGSLRPERERVEGKPTPAPLLAIPNPPALPYKDREDELKPVGNLADTQGRAGPQVLKNPLRILHERAVQRHAAMESYAYRLKRREVVNGSSRPEEVLLVKQRREPYSVHVKWIGLEGKDRELVYVYDKHDSKIHLLTAAADRGRFLLTGLRVPMALDDAYVRAKSRYPITEMGFGFLIERFGRVVGAVEKGELREGSAKYLGRVKRPEFEEPVEAVHQVIAANAEPLLPRGGERWYFFDTATGLPILTLTHDPSGEVEYYCHDQIQLSARFNDADFHPDRLGRK